MYLNELNRTSETYHLQNCSTDATQDHDHFPTLRRNIPGFENLRAALGFHSSLEMDADFNEALSSINGLLRPINVAPN